MSSFSLREFALALPHVEEARHMSAEAFRVDGKIFAQLSADETVALLKVELGEQEALLRAHPEHVWLPAHWGKFGWTYLRLANFTAREMRRLTESSWRLIAPKKLVAEFIAASKRRA